MVRSASPVRTCVGCRRRAPASELLRVVAVENHAVQVVAEPPSRKSGEAVFSVVPDPQRRRPGRGAHLHPDPACLAMAERRRAFGRALRAVGVIDTGPLTAEFARFEARFAKGLPPGDLEGVTTR